MHITARQEQFSRSAVFAVASRAGCTVSLRNVDDDSIDLTLGTKLLPSRPAVDVQLKCTFQDILQEDRLRFGGLSIKNYNDLRLTDLMVPRILVVVLVPPDIEDWLVHTEHEMLIRRCGYWVSLLGQPPTDNETRITVDIPRTNMFTPETLTAMMQQIHNGETL
jgi:hypothetical protein